MTHAQAQSRTPADQTTAAARQHYTFGDGGIAADRLRLLAATFEPSSARLLRMVACLGPRRAVDLGCGTGWSTRLVHAVTGPEITVGVDRSVAYVATAREVAPPGIAYAVHEVTAPPFPGEPPDLLYCRFLLTHLRDPQAVLATWSDAAAPGATLVLEETAAMASDHPALARYYALVDDLQAHHGQRMCLGESFEAAPSGSGWTTELSTVRRLALPAARMAALHAMNLATWRNDAYAAATFDDAELTALASALDAVAAGREEAPAVRYGMRQMVLTKR